MCVTIISNTLTTYLCLLSYLFNIILIKGLKSWKVELKNTNTGNRE